MKLMKPSQLIAVAAIGLIAAALLTACQIVTIDYLFVACSAGSGSGVIDVFAVDSETGALRTALSPISSGGSSPVAMVVTSNYQNLYVANQGTSSVAHFAIATNGELTKMDSVTLSKQGSF